MTRGRGRNPRKRTALDDLGDTLKDGIKTWEKGRIPFLDFLGSGAALGMITDIVDLGVAASCNDGGCDSSGKMSKAAILLFIHFVLVVYWWLRR